VESYELWLKVDNMPYSKITSLSDFKYEYINQNNGFEHCFVIKAIEKGGNQSYSWSNVDCITFAPQIYPYNVITPNEDSKNEMFIIKNIEYYPNSVLSIFNRWGKKIAEFKGYQNNWKGFDHGSILPNSTYYYVLELNDSRSNQPFINGMINILR
jgi:gliding motility-associated-like protein